MLENKNIVYSKTSRFTDNVFIKYSMLFVFLAYLVLIYTQKDSNLSNDDFWGMIFGFLTIIFVFSLLHFAKFEFNITSNGLQYRFFPIQFKYKFIHFSEIKYYEIRKYNPILEYGGWGIRYAFKRGWAFTVGGNIGLQIVTNDDKRILFGTNEPEILITHFNNQKKNFK